MKKTFIILLITIALVAAGLLFIRQAGPEPKKIEISQQLEAEPAVIKEPDSPAVMPEAPVKPEVDVQTEPVKNGATVKIEPAEDKSVQAKKSKIIQKLASWGFEKATGRKIAAVIIHSSYDALGSEPYDLDGLIREYKAYGVAPHYLIDRQGKIYQLVADQNIAYHAGVAELPDGRTNVNELSVGIEMMNAKSDKLTSEQYAALNALLKDLKAEYIPKYILGHDQVAPGRKDDPWNFDWSKINK